MFSTFKPSVPVVSEDERSKRFIPDDHKHEVTKVQPKESSEQEKIPEYAPSFFPLRSSDPIATAPNREVLKFDPFNH